MIFFGISPTGMVNLPTGKGRMFWKLETGFATFVQRETVMVFGYALGVQLELFDKT